MRSLSKFTRPIVVISKCLCGARCRWDRERLDYPFPFLRALRQYAKIIPVCPEMEIGLGVPRDRIVLAQHSEGVALFQPSTGQHLTRAMIEFAFQFLDDHEDIDGFILKQKSPSCGLQKVKLYKSTAPESKFTRTGTGLFAECVLELRPELAITDEALLEQHRTRDHWLTQLFTLADFRPVRKSHSLKRLYAFHTQHRVLLQTFHQGLTHVLERIIARSVLDDDACATIEQYTNVMDEIMYKPPRLISAIKPYVAAREHYASHLSKSDIKRFEHQLESFRGGELPLSEIRKSVQIWAVRYDKRFTRQDAVFRPYPGPLADA